MQRDSSICVSGAVMNMCVCVCVGGEQIRYKQVPWTLLIICSRNGGTARPGNT